MLRFRQASSYAHSRFSEEKKTPPNLVSSRKNRPKQMFCSCFFNMLDRNFLFKGSVRLQGRPIRGAIVDITSASQSGTGVTNIAGFYAISLVDDNERSYTITVTRNSVLLYTKTISRRTTSTGQPQTLNFRLL